MWFSGPHRRLGDARWTALNFGKPRPIQRSGAAAIHGIGRHAGMSGRCSPSHHPHVLGRYCDIEVARRGADRLYAMVYDLTANRIVYWSPGAQEALDIGRAAPIGRALNRADRTVDELESKTHGRGTAYRDSRGGGW